MSADELLQFITQSIYIAIFLVVAYQAWRRPDRARLNIALLFAMLALIIAEQWLVSWGRLEPTHLVKASSGALLLALPYLLLRLLSDYVVVKRWMLRLGELGLLLSVASLILIEEQDRPVWLTTLIVLYFVGLGLYDGYAFTVEAKRASGVTARRMQAVAIGTTLLGVLVLTALFQLALPSMKGLWMGLSRLLGLASGVAYFLGFAPPAWLRRAWQAPDLRRFLDQSSTLPWLPDTRSVVVQLQRSTAAAAGAPGAAVGLWDEDSQTLVFHEADGTPRPTAAGPGEYIAGRVFASQRAHFTQNALREDPAHAEVYLRAGAVAIMAAPMTAGERRIGVLAVFAPKAPIFGEDDLALLQIIADQAALIFESRRLMEEAARIRAREEATRLKDDFLSAAAHDLKTPLTGLLTQVEVLERKVIRRPDTPVELSSIQRIRASAVRLSQLVQELLDVRHLESARLVAAREEVDLARLAGECCAAVALDAARLHLEAPEPVVGSYDAVRIKQLLNNLIENALKYSPGDGEVRIKVWREGDRAQITVADGGIGIPASDLEAIFQRYHRASNVDDRRFAGMGLGLYICRAIAEEHGGCIRATSQLGKGSTFFVELPLTSMESRI